MRIWNFLKRLYAFFIPIRFSFIALAALIFSFWLSDQGSDILRALIEDKSRGEHLRVLALLATSLLLAAVIWYWSRHLLRYNPNERDEWPTLALWTPRILGVAVFLIEIVGIYVVSRQYKVEYPGKAWWTVGLLVLTAAIFWFLVVMQRTPDRTVRKWRDIGPETRTALLSSLVLELMLFIWATASPVSWRLLGVAAVLVLSIAAWVPLGSFLVGVAEKYRFPIIGFLIVWAFAISRCTDNHPVRRVSGPVNRAAMQTAFDAWYARVQLLPHAPGKDIPVFVVATEGGGIRAAYWTAAVLTHLQTDVPSFADHLFAISGVSGGSLGAITFDALLARHNELLTKGESGAGEPLPEQAKRFMNFDALSGTLAAMTQPDLLQRFIPAVILPDRQVALEHGWEYGWRHAFKNDNRFAGGLLAMSAAHPELPRLFINGTMVETGDRIVTSPIDVRSMLTFRNAFDAFDLLQSDIPLSTGAGMSARFAYVSPAGIISNPKAEIGHVIDGGYFENSGGVTAGEILDFLYDQRSAGAHIRPVVIDIDYWRHPTSDMSGPFCPAPGHGGPSPLPPARFAIDTLAPLLGFANTRDARGSLAVGDLAQRMRDPQGREDMVEFRLVRRDVPLPLGWVLSEQAMAAIDAAVHDEEGNRKAIAIIAQLIAGGDPQLPMCDGGPTAPPVNQKGVNN